jgi:transposase
VHADTESPLAFEALQRIAALYQIEALVRGHPADVRMATRAARGTPLFTELRTWLEKTQARISGKSDLAAEILYTLSGCQALTLVLRDGRVCIDNNAAERVMRRMCLGRKELAICRFELRWGAGGGGTLADRDGKTEWPRS